MVSSSAAAERSNRVVSPASENTDRVGDRIGEAGLVSNITMISVQHKVLFFCVLTLYIHHLD
jgi:hypothetical protein